MLDPKPDSATSLDTDSVNPDPKHWSQEIELGNHFVKKEKKLFTLPYVKREGAHVCKQKQSQDR